MSSALSLQRSYWVLWGEGFHESRFEV